VWYAKEIGHCLILKRKKWTLLNLFTGVITCSSAYTQRPGNKQESSLPLLPSKSKPDVQVRGVFIVALPRNGLCGQAEKVEEAYAVP
jgi:hypothetical protein